MRGTTQSTTGRRLAVYLSGLAIGLVMLGLFNARRTREMARREAQAAAAASERAAAEAARQVPAAPTEPAPPATPTEPAALDPA